MNVPIILIAATDKNNAIGRQGSMGWHLSEEFKHFKTTTMGHCILMGRKTFESIGKALPGRINLVLTRNAGWASPGVQAVKSLDEALAIAHMDTPNKPLFIAGGEDIYKQYMPMANAAVISRIDLELLDADAYFPELDSKWMLLSTEQRQDDSTGISFDIERYVRL